MLTHILFLISVSYENPFWQLPAMLFPTSFTSFLRSLTYIIPYKLYNPYNVSWNNHISPQLNLKTGCGKYMHVDLLLSERINSLFVKVTLKKLSKMGIWTQDLWHNSLLPYQLLHSELMETDVKLDLWFKVEEKYKRNKEMYCTLMCVRACVRACMHACVREWVSECVSACVRGNSVK